MSDSTQSEVGSSRDLMELVSIADEQRDAKWEISFFQSLTSTNVKVLSPDPQYGPDNWPYIMVASDLEASEPTQNLIYWLSEKGIGLVVNPQKDYPDYIFTYGMIWSFRETGLFFRPEPPELTKQVSLEPGQKLYVGEPSPEYLPPYVRNIIREFLRDQGFLSPKVLMLSTDGLQYDLAFSTESIGNPPEAEHESIAEALSWFLPPHYSLVLISEQNLPPFVDL
jgi:hypothetical protein